MSFCEACCALPFEPMFKRMYGDDDVQFPSGTRVESEFFNGTTHYTLYHAWHESIQAWLKASKFCPSCRIFLQFCEENYYYKAALAGGKDQCQVWFRLPSLGAYHNPDLRLFVGSKKPRGKISGQIRFSTSPDSVFAKYFGMFTPVADSFHPSVLEKLDSWIKTCDETHTACKDVLGVKATLPTRLLDLGSLPERAELMGDLQNGRKGFDKGSYKLIKSNAENMVPYIALSYCWGKGVPLTTIRANLESHMQDGGIQLSETPRTLQDAYFLVRCLGFRYIWVDCLCIVQDDNADWQREAARMGDVYSNANLTIASTRASHSSQGFLQLRERRERVLGTFPSIHGEFELYFECKDDLAPGSMGSLSDEFPLKMQREEPLLDRGWCFQERVLARRTVHFATTEMFWECENVFVSEGNRNFKPFQEYSVQSIARSLTPGSRLPGSQQVFDAWAEVIQEYTSRNLSFESDRLPALTGIINLLQEVIGDVCYAGLWRKFFLRGLCWRLQDPKRDSFVAVPKTPRRNAAWVGPSWSFAAVEGVVLYKTFSQGECAELEECRVSPLEASFARMKAPLTTIFDIAYEPTVSGRLCKIRTRNNVMQAKVYLDFEHLASCEVIMIAPYTGLAVSRVKDKQDTYVRLGLVDVPLDTSTLDTPNSRLSVSDWPTPSTLVIV